MFHTLYRCCSSSASCVTQISERNIYFMHRRFVWSFERVAQLIGRCTYRKLCNRSSSSPAEDAHTQPTRRPKHALEGPTLKNFIYKVTESLGNDITDDEAIPYVNKTDISGNSRRVFIETYGCQMNVSDTEIAWSILLSHGFTRASNIRDSDVILLMTCSVREGAEQKIWNRLEFLRSLKLSRQRLRSSSRLPPVKIGILGCMAERLKTRLLEKDDLVDVVCGPDAYRDLPRLLAVTNAGQTAVNVQLSLDETYADVSPVRIDANMTSAFVSIMRGCDNMCSYCIVPFTRGHERSRPIDSIVEEVKRLSDKGYKEVTLLGQNVNSYRDMSALNFTASEPPLSSLSSASSLSAGFHTVYRTRSGGLRFADLLSRVADIDPEMRIRFTSPHPKDFPNDLLYVIRDKSNVCRHIHLPAQSGSSQVLAAMRRGYTAEAYLDLVHHIRDVIPDVSLSSDFIAGFCSETEADHQLTLDLISRVKYNFVYCFPYSMRQKTRASHHLVDDVSDGVKRRRHQELVDAFRHCARQLNQSHIGQQHVILIDRVSKRSMDAMAGRTESNVRVIVPQAQIPTSSSSPSSLRSIQLGDYVVVQVNDATSQVMTATALYHTTLTSSNPGLSPMLSLAAVQ